MTLDADRADDLIKLRAENAELRELLANKNLLVEKLGKQALRYRYLKAMAVHVGEAHPEFTTDQWSIYWEWNRESSDDGYVSVDAALDRQIDVIKAIGDGPSASGGDFTVHTSLDYNGPVHIERMPSEPALLLCTTPPAP